LNLYAAIRKVTQCLQAGGQPHITFLFRSLHPRDERACLPGIDSLPPPYSI